MIDEAEIFEGQRYIVRLHFLRSTKVNDLCDLPGSVHSKMADFPDPPIDNGSVSGPRHAVLAGGCFACVEGVYRQLDGVLNAISVYTGDSAKTANFTAVSSGTTNHVEAVEIEYDPQRLSFGRLLKVFFSVAHDPTQLDRQGENEGRHYRSVIFYADGEQKRVAQAYILRLDQSGVFDSPVVTALEPLSAVYPAESELQDYVARNHTNPYVVRNALPKVEKVRTYFADDLKS